MSLSLQINATSAQVQTTVEGATVPMVATLPAISAPVTPLGLSSIPTPSMVTPFTIPVPSAGPRVTFPPSMTQFMNDPANLQAIQGFGQVMAMCQQNGGMPFLPGMFPFALPGAGTMPLQTPMAVSSFQTPIPQPSPFQPQVVSAVAPVNLIGALNAAGSSRPPQDAHPQATPEGHCISVESDDEEWDVPRAHKKKKGKALRPTTSRNSAFEGLGDREEGQRKSAKLRLGTAGQRESENLTQFLTRWKEEVDKVEEMDDKTVLSLLLNDLRAGELYKEFCRKPPATYQEAYHTAWEFAEAETQLRAKKEAEHGFKPKPVQVKKEEALGPSRPRHHYDPVVRVVNTEECQEIRKAPVNPPEAPTGQPRRQWSDTYCSYHRPVAQWNDRDNDRRRNNRQREQQPAPDKEHIGMIFGGPEGGDSAAQRKNWVRSIYIGEVNAEPVRRKQTRREPIVFTDQDLPATGEDHNDPLVITMDINGVDVAWVLVDTSSSVNILYLETFQKLRLCRTQLDPLKTPLSGFTGDTVEAEGSIVLPVELGSGDKTVWKKMRFIVVDIKCVHNAILGRPGINKVRAVISMSHLCMKFHTPGGVGEVKGDHRNARECYARAVKKMTKGVNVISQEITKGEIREKLEPEAETVEIELHPGDSSRMVRIGANLQEDLKAEITRFLQEYAGIFAWSVADMPGIDRSIICHRLAVRDGSRPVCQKKRYLASDRRDFVRKEVKDLLSVDLPVNKPTEQWWEMAGDGASGPKSYGGVIVFTTPEGFKIYHALVFNFKLTNNEAEYEALAGGLRLAQVESFGITNVTIDGLRGGQRKRSRTGKNVASSLAPPPPPAHKYLDGSFLWFNDHAEATRFSEKFEHREILPPRFSTGRFIHSAIPRQARVILESGRFLDLLYIKKNDYHPFLVRAFYSNLKKDEDGSLISNVNGVEIYLNEENIQILTGLRRDGQDLGLYVGEEGARFNETALLEEVGIRNFVPTPQQRRPTISSMSLVYRFIFYVLTRILKPRKFNHTTLSQEDTKTIHAMIHNANINWCKFVMIHMFNATSDNRPLPYALLVMAILDEYHIKTDVGPKCKGTKHWVIDESSFHPGTDEATFPQPRPRRQPRATASTATPSTNLSLAEQMAALTTTLSRIDTSVSKTAHKVDVLSRELHGYFDFDNYPYAQMVPYVPPLNFGGEPSGTQNVGRDDAVDVEEEEEAEEEEEEEEEEADDDDDDGDGDEDGDDEEEDIDEEQLLNDLSPDF
ncbi:unnamed protein product [Cuscuta campestris]|uniref:RNase H type-1 domain-containing protein n=1 Tax=Cuscuta campestris TaxID=132261 RepID=A0A484NRN8_9ASTE|nr:unnamed protein product [Cuscuta campestris]